MKTATVRLGDRVTIGLGSVIGIGVTVGSDVQVGALSLVPKHATLAGGCIYVGVPARRLGSDAAPSARAAATPGGMSRDQVPRPGSGRM